jgi:hypothetical protein
LRLWWAAAALASAIAGPASGSAPSVRDIDETGTEHLTVAAHSPVQSEFTFTPGRSYLLTVSGAITDSDGGVHDAFYYKSRSSDPPTGPAGLDVSFTGADHQGPNVFASAIGVSAIPPYRSNHVYSLVLDCCFPEARPTFDAVRNFGGAFTGAFQLQITPLIERWRTGFRFTQKGQPDKAEKGVSVVSGGAGNIFTAKNPDTRDGEFSTEAKGSVIVTTKVDSEKVSFTAKLGKTAIVSKPNRGREVSADTTITRSNDPRCDVGSAVNLLLEDGRDPKFDRFRIMEGSLADEGPTCNVPSTFRPSKSNNLDVKIFAPEKADFRR